MGISHKRVPITGKQILLRLRYAHDVAVSLLYLLMCTSPFHRKAHERGVAHMSFCLHHSLALSAGVFVNTLETTPHVLVWRLDRSCGLLEHDVHARLKGHEGQVQLRAVVALGGGRGRELFFVM